jgi:hypothetical protein
MSVMKTITATIVVAILWLCFSTPPIFATPNKKDEVTVVIPGRVLAQFIRGVLPVQITWDKKVAGAVWVQSIDRLTLGLNAVSFSISIRGEDITWTGKFGDLPTRLSFGRIHTSVDCEASIRYDRARHILYVKPMAIDVGNSREVLRPLLVALIGDREYPIQIQKLKPIIVEFANRTVTIDINISNVYTADNRVFIGISPSLRANRQSDGGH